MKNRGGSTFGWFTAVLYIVLGISFIYNPGGMASALGFEELNKNALTDVMATYGGLEIGLGLLLVLFLCEKNLTVVLRIILLTFAGFALGRSIGAIRFGGFFGLHLYWLIFELTYLLVCGYFIKKNKQYLGESTCV
jgi:hypothetical protein